MSNKPLRRCAYPACKSLTRKSYCEKHAKITEEKQKQQKEKRREFHTTYKDERGKNIYGWQWQKARKAYLLENPFCGHCLLMQPKQYTQAKIVDHIKPHKGDIILFWDRSNWQGLCKFHHDVKTASFDGGFGNRGLNNGK